MIGHHVQILCYEEEWNIFIVRTKLYINLTGVLKYITKISLFCCLSSNMKTNDEVVENICVLFSELVEYGKLTCAYLSLSENVVVLPSITL